MVNVSVAQAMQAAERLRSEFASLQFADLPISPTVSVGLAMASEAGRNLSVLLALADQALYRAKADGRDRVAPAPFIRLEAAGGEAVRRQIERPLPVARLVTHSPQSLPSILSLARAMCPARRTAPSRPLNGPGRSGSRWKRTANRSPTAVR